MGTSTMTGRTTNGLHRASFIPMPHSSGTLGDCTAIVREPSLCRTRAPYTRTGNTGQSRSAPFSSPMCSRLATQRYSPQNIVFSPPGSGWSLLVSVCHRHLWLQRKSPSSSSCNNLPIVSRSEVTVNAFALQWQPMLRPALRLEPLLSESFISDPKCERR